VRAYLCFGQVEELPLRKIRQIRIINCKAFEIRMGARVELRTTFACGILIVCPGMLGVYNGGGEGEGVSSTLL